MTPELHRPVSLDRIGPQGTEVLVEADPEELRRLAERMSVPGIGALRCRFLLRRVGGETVEARGELHARVTQVCVVTLDEFEGTVDETFTVRFVPDEADALAQGDLRADDAVRADVAAATDARPLVDDRGRVDEGLAARVAQRGDDVAAEEPGGPGDDDGHAGRSGSAATIAAASSRSSTPRR